MFVEADVRRFEDVERLVRDTVERYRRIDFVIASAGLYAAGDLTEGAVDHWRAVIETNVLGAVYAARAVLPTLQRQGRGHIVLVGSVAGRETFASEPIYCASKWAITGFGQALRKQVQGSGVRVTLVQPGLVDTSMTRSDPNLVEAIADVEPLQADDVARTVAFVLLQPPHVAVTEVVVMPSDQGN